MVNTFLPVPSIHLSPTYLDRQRLGQQRREAKQILRALRGETRGWVNHPATRMWRGYEGALCLYGIVVCLEWTQRGYKDSLMPYFTDMAYEHRDKTLPWWFGLDIFHDSHKSNLIRKKPEHYSGFWLGIPTNLPYFWPVSK